MVRQISSYIRVYNQLHVYIFHTQLRKKMTRETLNIDLKSGSLFQPKIIDIAGYSTKK